jgi:hypothetical protein
VVIVCLGIEIDGKWQEGIPEALINPQIIEMSDERKDFDGCLIFLVYMGNQYVHIAYGLSELMNKVSPSIVCSKGLMP